MKKNRRYRNNKEKLKKANISIFLGVLAVSIVLQYHAIKIAYLERGRFLFGGEWLTAPLIFLLWYLLIEVSEFFGIVKRSNKNVQSKE